MRSDSGSSAIQLHPEFMAAVQDAETYEAAIACAKGQGWPATTVVNADIAQVIQALSRGRPPGILLVDVDGLEDAAMSMAQLVKVCAGKSQILAIGTANDVPFYRGMLQAGAADYLVKPLNSVNLRDAIVPLLSAKLDSDKGGKRTHDGKIFVVVGVRGGVGATTIAVNAAWIMAHEMGKKVALIDLDLQFGNCDLALDLEPARGLREVLTTPERMDSLLINSSLTKESDDLSVFCAEESIEEVIDYDVSGPLTLIKEIRGDYDCIIVDMPRHMVPRHRRLLVSADQIFLASDMTLVGIREVQRIMMAISNLGTAAPIHTIATHVNDGEPQIKRGDFESNIKSKLKLYVPHDPKTIRQSAIKGKSVLEVGGEGTALAKSYRNIASTMTGIAVEKTGSSGAGGFLSGLFGKK